MTRAVLSPTPPMSPRDAWLCREVAGSTRVLDLGCGSGERAFALARMGLAVTVIDADPVAIEAVVARVAPLPAAQRPDLRVHDAADLPFPAETFDAVIIAAGLAHEVAPARLFGEALRVLVRDGLLALAARYGSIDHDDHTDTLYLDGLAQGLHQGFSIRTIELMDDEVLVVARAGGTVRADLDRLLFRVAEDRLRERDLTIIRATKELDELRDALARSEDEARRQRARADKLRRDLDRQRGHWSWRTAVRLRRIFAGPARAMGGRRHTTRRPSA